MLLDVAFREVDLDVGDVACLVTNRGIDGVHETFVGREVKFLIASQNLFVEVLVDLHGVFLDHLFRGSVVAFGSDALDFCEEFTVETAEALIIVDSEVMFAVTLDDLHLFVRRVLIDPVGDELAVAHVRLLDVLARLDTHELGHEAVHLLLVVTGFEGFFVGQKTQFHEFRIAQEIQAEEVCAGFLDG